MDIYSGLLPCYLLSIDHHCNLSLVPIPIPIILKSPSMDSSLHGDAFPSNDISSEFQFDCAFRFVESSILGLGGTSTSSAHTRVDLVALHLVTINLSMMASRSITLLKIMLHLGAVVVAVFVVLIAIFELRVSNAWNHA